MEFALSGSSGNGVASRKVRQNVSACWPRRLECSGYGFGSPKAAIARYTLVSRAGFRKSATGDCIFSLLMAPDGVTIHSGLAFPVPHPHRRVAPGEERRPIREDDKL